MCHRLSGAQNGTGRRVTDMLGCMGLKSTPMASASGYASAVSGQYRPVSMDLFGWSTYRTRSDTRAGPDVQGSLGTRFLEADMGEASQREELQILL